MNLGRLILREIFYRKLNFILGVLSVLVAVGSLVAVLQLLDQHDQRTEAILQDVRGKTETRLAEERKQTETRLAKLEDDYRKIGVGMGFNMLILPKDQNLADLYADDGATFPMDTAVPSGTTDYSQFVLTAEEKGVGGVMLAVGEQEAIQVVNAAVQLSSDLKVSSTLGTFPSDAVEEFGDFAEQMVFVNSFPPATAALAVMNDSDNTREASRAWIERIRIYRDR